MLLKLLLSILTVVFVLLGLALAVLLPMAWKNVHGDISVASFAVAGAIVALVLPAAGLGRDAAQKVIDDYMEGTRNALLKSKDSTTPSSLTADAWARLGLDRIRSLRNLTAAARWGSGLIYLGFLLAMFSMLELTKPVTLPIGREPIPLWHVAVAEAMACLALGAILFLPLAWWFWSPSLLDKSEQMLNFVVDHADQLVPPSTAQPAQQGTAQPAQQGTVPSAPDQPAQQGTAQPVQQGTAQPAPNQPAPDQPAPDQPAPSAPNQPTQPTQPAQPSTDQPATIAVQPPKPDER